MAWVEITDSYEETIQLGEAIASTCTAGDILLFYGDLGAGKTTLIKGIARGLCQVDPMEVQSPTFVYMQIYAGAPPLYHFDLYRLSSDQEFYSLGLDEFLAKQGICCIEWPEKVPSLEEENVRRVRLSHLGEGRRSIEVCDG